VTKNFQKNNEAGRGKKKIRNQKKINGGTNQKKSKKKKKKRGEKLDLHEDPNRGGGTGGEKVMVSLGGGTPTKKKGKNGGGVGKGKQGSLRGKTENVLSQSPQKSKKTKKKEQTRKMDTNHQTQGTGVQKGESGEINVKNVRRLGKTRERKTF